MCTSVVLAMAGRTGGSSSAWAIGGHHIGGREEGKEGEGERKIADF